MVIHVEAETTDNDATSSVQKEDDCENAWQTKMLLQLHEQYAQNNNANLSSIIGLISATIIVLGFYGYVFVYSSLDFAEDLGSLRNYNAYTIDVLVLMTAVVFIVVGILQYICLYQGSHQRFEQFITHAIRCKFGLFPGDKFRCQAVGDTHLNDIIFPKGYHPFYKTEKTEEVNEKGEKPKEAKSRFHYFLCGVGAFIRPGRNMNDIVQGLFGELVKIFSIILWCVFIATGAKLLCANSFTGLTKLKAAIQGTWCLCSVKVLVVIIITVNAVIACKAAKLRRKYDDYCVEFGVYKPEEEPIVGWFKKIWRRLVKTKDQDKIDKLRKKPTNQEKERKENRGKQRKPKIRNRVGKTLTE